MSQEPDAFLVVRHEDGYGDVFPLLKEERLTMGRASTNRIVLKDELCSREHAEVYFADGCWRLRDLNSLNGTRLNDLGLESEWELSPRDEINVGRTHFLFVQQISDLPEINSEKATVSGISIKQRMGQTRFLTPLPAIEDEAISDGEQQTLPQKHSLSRDLALLYRLSLRMGSAKDYEELIDIVLDGLMEATTAEVGAILSPKENGEFQIAALRPKEQKKATYHKISEFVSNDVLARKEAVLAEDVARDQYLRNRESLAEIGATSLICAPVLFEQKVLALVHLYCTNPLKILTVEDLEFTVAVAKHLGSIIVQLERQANLIGEIESLRDQLRVESELVGESPQIKEIESQIGRVAQTNATVLIRGESGVGKELVARAIHFSSRRRGGPFICLNCAAITETLLESELFGHEKGAFTGATDKKIGKFEAANKGTIFLDEIGEMSVTTQAKLLRVLEGHPFERVGGGTQISVDVRVVAATNQPLEQAMKEGNFRRDLFYRLQVVEIHVPPLRERRGDIALIAEHFLNRFVRETGRRIRGFTDEAISAMSEYQWPGNVRELRNAVERAVALAQGNMLDAQDLWFSSTESAVATISGNDAGKYEPISISELEKGHIERTLEYTDWNKTQAAAILKIERSTLDRKIKSYDLKR